MVIFLKSVSFDTLSRLSISRSTEISFSFYTSSLFSPLITLQQKARDAITLSSKSNKKVNVEPGETSAHFPQKPWQSPLQDIVYFYSLGLKERLLSPPVFGLQFAAGKAIRLPSNPVDHLGDQRCRRFFRFVMQKPKKGDL